MWEQNSIVHNDYERESKDLMEHACPLHGRASLWIFWMVGNCTVFLWSIWVTTLVIAVNSRLYHGIFGHPGYAEMPAAGYPGIYDLCQNCEGGVFHDTFVTRNICIKMVDCSIYNVRNSNVMIISIEEIVDCCLQYSLFKHFLNYCWSIELKGLLYFVQN